jgi:Protein of unknown function (DUF3592)
MSFIAVFGTILLIAGAMRLKIYIQTKKWPVVKGTLDSVDLKIEPTAPTEVVGFFFQPKYIHKIQYSYHGHPYVVDISEDEVIGESLNLRINPEKPSEAYLDNKTLVFPVVAIAIGVLLLLVSIKIGTNEK